MMGWALLVIVFCVAGIQKHGFTLGPVVNALLINIYLVKFEAMNSFGSPENLSGCRRFCVDNPASYENWALDVY